MAPLATGAVVAGVTLNPADAGAGDLYLRAKMGHGRSSETVFGDRDCLITSPVELPRAATVQPAFVRRFRDGSRARIRAQLLSYACAGARDAGRIPHPRLAFEGRAKFLEPRQRQLVEAELLVPSAMLVPKVDLSALGLPGFVRLAHFLGAGVYAVRNRISYGLSPLPRAITARFQSESEGRPQRYTRVSILLETHTVPRPVEETGVSDARSHETKRPAPLRPCAHRAGRTRPRRCAEHLRQTQPPPWTGPGSVDRHGDSFHAR